MRLKDADILLLPGKEGAGEGHWLTRWERKLATARLVDDPARLLEAVAACARRVVLVAHGSGAMEAASPTLRVAGAFLVAPLDRQADAARTKLPFHAHVIGSEDDPLCSLEAAKALAACWGATFASAGAAGHIDEASGYGPWPEGLMSFGGFMGRLL
jgi:predicted alpha/beta hydrolase family esterase